MKKSSLVTTPFAYWHKEFDKAAMRQGWNLFDRHETIEIQRIDDPNDGPAKFADDKVVMDYIVNQALCDATPLRKRKMCLTALYFDGRPTNELVDIPRFLRV